MARFPRTRAWQERIIAAAAFALALGFAQARAQIFITAPPSLQGLTPYKPAPEPAPLAAPAPQSPIEALSESHAEVTPPQSFVEAPTASWAATAAAEAVTSKALAAPSDTQRIIQTLETSAARETPRLGPSVAAAAPAGPPPTTHSAPLGVGQGVASGEVLRHLTNNIQGFRLTGEIGSSEWPFFVTAAQAQLRLRFQVGYLAAVSVMPEASYLTLTINDVQVGRTNIIGTRGVRTASFDIPAGLVKPGFNSVRLTAEHRHRVDCSINATYELWTQIDPTLTGLVVAKNAMIVSSLAELPGLPPDEEGALPIRAVLPGRGTMAGVERIVRAVQAISLAGRFAQPIVDVGPLADGEYGINLAIGTAADLGAVLNDISLNGVYGPRVLIIPAMTGRRATVVVTGRTDDDVASALAQLSVTEDMVGSEQGLRAAAAFPGFRIVGGQRVQLHDLGLSSQEFSGRLYRAAFNLIMPPDFYSADYAKATLDLAGGYAAGLDRNAQVVVSINGRNVVSLKLPKSSGAVFKENPIPLPLGSLKPGLNRVEIEAQLPSASDAACDPINAIAGKKRFLFLDTTEIEIPRIARIARMPDLAVTATGGYPYIGSSKRPNLYVPAPSREAVGAAATLAAHFAIAAGRVIDFRLSVTDPGEGSGATLVVAPATSVDEPYLKSVNVDPQTLIKIWSDRLLASARSAGDEDRLSKYEASARHRLVLQRNFPAACHMPTPAGGFRAAVNLRTRALDANPVASIADERDARDLYGEWNSSLRGQGGVLDWFQNKWKPVGDFFASHASGAKTWFDETFDGVYRKPAFTKQASLIIAQNILGATGDDVRTVVIAPTAAQLAQSVDCLVDPRVWRQIGGGVSVLNAADGEIVEIPAESPRLIQTQPLSIENTRLIVAGWLSLNRAIYVELALVIALVLAWSTNRFIKSVGRRS